MPSTASWIVLAILVLVLLSPLSEIFDNSDELLQDGSDFVAYIVCVFAFLAYYVAHGSVMIAKFAALELQTLIPLPRNLFERIDSRDSKQERNLFLANHDLRI
jgi:hypothetical protein